MGGPKISRLFFLSRHHFVLFVCLRVSSRGILVVMKRRGLMCTFGVLRLSCVLGGPAEGGPGRPDRLRAVRRRGVLRRGGSGPRWSREVQTNNNHNNAKTQNKWARRVGPRRV